MKLQKLLLLAGLLLASGLQAMQPLAPGLISTDYSDDSGSESDVEEFPRTVKKYPDQPLILPKKSTSEPAALLFEKEYDKPYIGGVTRAPLKDEPTLEKEILEYADKPRVYPALPKGLFIPPPSTKESDIQPGQKKALADVPSLAKEPQIYTDKPTKLPTKKEEFIRMEQVKPSVPAAKTLPIVNQPEKPVVQKSPFKVQQAAGIFATLLGRKVQHSEFEVAIANSTDTPYKIIFNNQTLTLEPNQVQTVNLPDLVKVTGSTIVRTRTAQGITTRTATSRTVELQTIMLQRASDKQEFSLNIGRGSNDKKQIVAIISITQGKKVIKTTNVNFNPPAIGQNVYYLMQVNLMGKDLQETTIEIVPTLAQ